MSDKQRLKKDGKDKGKKLQARRRDDPNQEPRMTPPKRVGSGKRPARPAASRSTSSPPAARRAAGKEQKGK